MERLGQEIMRIDVDISDGVRCHGMDGMDRLYTILNRLETIKRDFSIEVLVDDEDFDYQKVSKWCNENVKAEWAEANVAFDDDGDFEVRHHAVYFKNKEDAEAFRFWWK